MRNISLLFYLLFVPLVVHAEQFEQELYVSFQTISITDGLSHNYTTAVVRDAMGFLWIGTTEGLNRYDGYAVKVYRHTQNSASLSNNYVQSLFLDSRGILWIGTKNGLNRYVPEQDHFVRYMPNSQEDNVLSGGEIVTIYEDVNRHLWIGTRFGGLNFFDVEDERFAAYQHNPSDDWSISSNYVTAIQEDAQGRLWVGTYNAGVNVFNPRNHSFTRFFNNTFNPSSLSNNTVLCMYLDADENLWIGTSYLLNKLVVENADWPDFDASFIRMHNPHLKDLTDNRITSIVSYDDHRMFLSYKNQGLFVYDTEQGEFLWYRNQASLRGMSYPINILDLFLDQQSLLWMATREAGLKMYNPRTSLFGHITHIPQEPRSLPDYKIDGIAFDSLGQMWLATYTNGVAVYNPEKKLFDSYRGGGSRAIEALYNRATAIFVDQQNRIWVGSTGGILHFTQEEIQKDPFLQNTYRYNFKNRSHFLTVNCFFQDSDGLIWVGTEQGLIGIDYYGSAGKERAEVVYYYDPEDTNSLVDNNVLAINEDAQGNLWVGTERGLCRMDKHEGKFTCYTSDATNPSTISSNRIHVIYVDQEGILWVGTSGGLSRFDPLKKQFTNITTQEGLPNNSVWGIVEDDKQNLWLSTNNGLASFNKLTRDVIRYSKGDGLQAGQFTYGAYAMSPEGKLCFGGINGINCFDPLLIEPDTVPPVVVLTAFKCFNKEVFPGDNVKGKVLLDKSPMLTNSITLKHYHNVITFEFAALQYSDPLANQYMYQLEGFDPEWVPVRGEKPSVTYTSLPPGKYRFIVKAANASGVWSQNDLVVHLQVLPPFYRTLWFYAFCLILLAGSIVLLIKIRERRLLENNMLLNYEKDLLQTLLDNIPDHIFFKDKNSRFIRINKAMAKNLGLNHPDDAVGKSDFDFLPAEVAKQTLQEEYKILKKGASIINDVVKRIRAEREVWVSITKVPMFNKSGEIAGVAGISRDFSSQKEAEMKIREAEMKAIEADRMKTVFLANMSHEVRTPMNSIVGFSDLLDDPDIGEKERKDYISYIKNNSEILMRLIDDILDTAKIEANQVKIIKKEFNLHKFLDELLDTFEINKVKLNKPHLKLSLIKSPEKKKLKVFTDSDRLRQVMSNLINNAIKFTEEGSVSFGYEVKEDHAIYFFVKDTGIGIAPEMQNIVFDRFGHSEGRFEKNIQGTGLGLSISSKLVSLLGGEIQLESKPGEGSTFSFTLSNIIG